MAVWARRMFTQGQVRVAHGTITKRSTGGTLVLGSAALACACRVRAPNGPRPGPPNHKKCQHVEATVRIHPGDFSVDFSIYLH